MLGRIARKGWRDGCLSSLQPGARWEGFRGWASGPRPIRDPRFAQLTDGDIAHFKSIVGESGVLQDANDLEGYNTDWMLKYKGSSSLVLRPGSTREVSEILKHCDARRLAVVPQGGNTGLVGGSVPLFDEVVLSTSRLDEIRSFDEASGVLVCGAGCVLEALDEHLLSRGATVPLDLGAKGSCQIGGNVSTNAGGLRRLRYGSMHARVLGLETVLPNGDVLDRLSVLKKDNTGYDIKHAFIGAEGTLGVVTAVALDCPPAPRAVELAFLAVASFEDAQAVYASARRGLGEVLSAAEFLDRQSLEVVEQYLPGARSPLEDGEDALFFVLLEASGAHPASVSVALEETLGGLFESGLVLDGVVASSDTQRAQVWQVREGISEALRHRGAIYKYDLSFRLPEMYGVVEEARRRVEQAFPDGDVGGGGLPAAVVGYGHLGDGNVHLNISVPRYDERVEALLEPWVYEYTAERRGSISAEHGLGQMKAAAMAYSQPPEAIRIMRAWKQSLDPNGIMNPYKVLPPVEE